jgi:hypothetical protein
MPLPDHAKTSQRDELPSIVVEADNQCKTGTETCQLGRCTSSREGVDSAVGSDCDGMYLPTRGPTSGQDDNALRPEVSRISGTTTCLSEQSSRQSRASSPNLSLSLTYQEDDIVEPMDLSIGDHRP